MTAAVVRIARSTREFFPVDLDGNPRFNADEDDSHPECRVPVFIDMGAYEYQFDPVADVIFADLNGDGFVNATDLAMLLSKWGDCDANCCPADLNCDCEVGPTDLATLLAQWG